MTTLTQLPYILALCFLGSFCGLAGGLILLWKEKLAHRISHVFVAFAVGALLGSAFFDLIPESIKISEYALIFVLAGIVVFSITERALVWHHHKHHPEPHLKKPSAHYVPLLIIGDSIHNFIDGVIIAGTFLFNAPLGLITTLAVFFHEMPQEIGDFGVMLHAKYPHDKILLYNVLSACATFVGALVVFFMSYLTETTFYPFLAFAAGGFIYIAATDLLPELRHEACGLKDIVSQTTLMIFGIVVMVALSVYFGI